MIQAQLDERECVVLGEAWVGKIADIISFTTDGNYTKVSTLDGHYHIRKNSHECEVRLPSIFFRSDRGCLFNMRHVKHIRRYDNKRLALVLADKAEIILSRTQSMAFRKAKIF